jgi:mannose-6-phosphate isomerase-like protein (cupin superfamily)
MMNQNTFNNDAIREDRPWGYFAVLEETDAYKVKKLVINPHHRLSLQLHKHRDEQWVVVKGNPYLRCGEVSREYSTGESVTIKKGALHRIENNTDSEVIIIEVQSGDYFGEDDIVRLEDDYSRKTR